MNKISKANKEVFNRLLQKEDLIHHHKNYESTFSDIEINIALLIILFVIVMLFWVPIIEIF